MNTNEFTLQGLKPLLEQFDGDGLIVSCFADLSVEHGHQSRWQGPFKAKSDALKKSLADDERGWESCKKNLEAIRNALEGNEARHAQGLAIFSAGQRGLFQAIPLAAPVENELVVHQSPYLVPLLKDLLARRNYLGVQCDTHRGRIYAANMLGVQLLHEIQESVPKKQRSSGERWGKEQATIARHREECIRHFHKDLFEIIEKVWTKQPFCGVILLGEHEVLEHIRKKMPSRLSARVIREAPHSWSDKPLNVGPAIRAILEETDRTQQRMALEELANRMDQSYLIATKIDEVIDSLQNGAISADGHGYLIIGPDPRETIARCSACRFLSVKMPTTCPRCQSPCVDASLWEEVLLHALRHDIAVRFVKPDENLARHGGLVAILNKEISTTAIT